MSGSAFNPIKKYLYLIVGFALIFAANYMVFHLLFVSEGKKQIISWLRSEAVDLQQGNLMTSFSKFDRVLAHKSDIESIALLKVDSEKNFRVLAQIGKAVKFGPLATEFAASNFRLEQKGLFEYDYYVRLPNDYKMALAARISSNRFAVLTFINSIAISFILFLVNVWQSRFRRRQEKERNQFLVGIIKGFVQSPSSASHLKTWKVDGVTSNEFQEIIFGLHRQTLERDRWEATNRLAKQVAHDIRSPLSALNMLVSSVKEMPEEQRSLLRTVSRRINDIANNLLKAENSDARVFLASLALNLIVSEKRLQFSDRVGLKISRDFQDSSKTNFLSLSQVELTRAISNLINNSVEAEATHIRVRLFLESNWTVIEITDDGHGIPPEHLARLGDRGFSQGKTGTDSGSGIGVHHARSLVENAGGKFAVSSTVGTGTSVSIRLPTAPAPSWYASSIPVKTCSDIFVIDDDPTVRSVWAERLRTIDCKKSLHTFESTDSFARKFAEYSSSAPLYLIDYEFSNQKKSGLDLIEDLDIGPQSILVTSHYDDPAVQARASRLRVKVLPKQLADSAPLV